MKKDTTTAYPVYTGSLDKFTLMPYSFVAEDTVTMHFKMDHLKKHVAETLADRHYTAVLLTLEDAPRLLTAAEGGNINGSQFESICCYNSAGTAVAGVTLTWQEHGYWK